MKPKILVVRKMSAFEYYYNGNHKNKALIESHEEQQENVKKVLEKLENHKFIYNVITRKELTKDLVNQYDFVFSLGGDGTVIATASFNKDKPQLNIKTDEKSRGSLCSSNTEQTLKDFFKNNYKIEEWTRQGVYLNSGLVGRALNETAIGEEGMRFTKMARYDLESDNLKESQKNSGLIIVTGTGSTGWPNAFKPYSKTSKQFKFTTLLPSEGQEKGKGDYFKIEYQGHNGNFAIDTIEYDFPKDSVLEIKLSENPLKVIK